MIIDDYCGIGLEKFDDILVRLFIDVAQASRSWLGCRDLFKQFHMDLP